ncbi:MAG: ABC transporter permease [Ekhidna sp.]
MSTRAPKLPTKFLQWFCKKSFVESIQGDLEEQFEEDKIKLGTTKAKWRFTWNVIRFFRPGIIKSFEGTQRLNNYGMFKHNLLITFRSFKRNKSSFLINLMGLSTGLACVLFIYLWINDEVKKDKFHSDANLIYQVYSNHNDASGTFTWKGVPGLLADELEAKVPEVQYVVAGTDAHEYSLKVEGQAHKVNGKFASEDFFNVFDFPLLHGDPTTALADKSSIIITETLAKSLFNKTDVVGETLEFTFWHFVQPLKVSAVLKDLTTETSDQFQFIMSWNYYHDELIEYKQWGNYYARVVMKLKEGADVKSAEEKTDAIFKENLTGTKTDLFLKKYADQYLYNNYENGKQAGGRIDYVILFATVAIFILIIACINFINLSTAKASQRSKEIGVKKSLGASKKSLMSQFFTETILLSFISLIIAFALVAVLLPNFNYLAQKELTLQFDLSLLMNVFALILIVGVIAGSYPALHLSAMRTIKVLKPSLTGSTKHGWGRKSLVVFQFVVSIVLIVATILIQRQMNYAQTKNLGYDRDNIIYFEREGKLLENHNSFLAEMKKLEGVEKAAASGFMVGGANSTGGVHWEGKEDKDQLQFFETDAGYGLTDVLGIELVSGRDFDPSFGADSASILFNETAIELMAMEDPIGKTIRHYSGNKKIIGIVKDFNLESLHKKVEPALFLFNPEETHFIMAKIENGTELKTMARIETLYKKFNPNYTLNVNFLDQDYQAQYASEERVASLSGYFAGLAILISCLGLFGLASFTIERRVKEIGIRKVLGSNVTSILLLLTKDFTKMVIVAVAIGIPLSYYLGSKWLESYAYSIDLEWWLFGLAGILALIISWVTVGTQTLKAAKANPVDSLKDE